MTNSRVTGVRSIELGVRDLHQSAEFYTKVWALEEVSADGDSIHFRATGGEHHVLTIRERPQASLLGVHFAAADRDAVDQLCARAKGYGVALAGDPVPLEASAGGGYGFRFETPDGLPMSISADLVQHPSIVLDRSRPTKISHVVLNSARTDDQVPFFIDVLGFKVSDSTHMMEFLRCSADHHSVAIFRNNGPSLNHVAYELPNMDGLMRGTGRVKQSGFEIAWGIGRHGPGSNVFSYFIEPNGFVAEYTTELDQLDDATHVPQGPDYWKKMMPLPDRWGTAGAPSNRMRAAHVGRALISATRRRPALRGHHRPQARLIEPIECTGSRSNHGRQHGGRSPQLSHERRHSFDKSFDLAPETVEEVVPGVRRLLAEIRAIHVQGDVS
jgi:catechol 2,3-dioxygenase